MAARLRCDLAHSKGNGWVVGKAKNPRNELERLQRADFDLSSIPNADLVRYPPLIKRLILVT